MIDPPPVGGWTAVILGGRRSWSIRILGFLNSISSASEKEPNGIEAIVTYVSKLRGGRKTLWIELHSLIDTRRPPDYDSGHKCLHPGQVLTLGSAVCPRLPGELPASRRAETNYFHRDCAAAGQAARQGKQQSSDCHDCE